ncbi:VOC family protein [Amycolatopsis granulosa]|uniref:VOC family protein n=1 Tax=Amycolatopsis granulosa TaxID=185684 RepID=UPI001420089C|nr:VOC family protein [Amycolatopsis granulosa]NIH84839.1 hypothetical protein [Amycolatopsis granulosa]
MSVGSSAPSPLPSGVPCWVELASVDEAASHRFYEGLFGWTFLLSRDPATRTGRYLIGTLGGVPVGGLYQAAPGQASAWMVNISVHNAHTAANWVRRLGGTVTLEPTVLPQRGCIVHGIEPSGAPFVLWQPPPDWVFATGYPNTFDGADLNTRDGAAADHFFCRLFQYTSLQVGDSRGIDYAEWRLEQEPVLYRYVMGPEYPPQTPPHWMVYFAVDPARGADATAGHALMLGGTVLVEPYDTPWGRMAILADPAGAVFSIIDHTQVGEGWGRAEVDDPYDD